MKITHPEIVAAAESIVERLAANAPASEAARSLAADSVEAMRAAGLWRILTPRRRGGSGADFRTQVAASSILTRGDAAAGWLAVVVNPHAWVLGSFPERCQEEVFSDPDVLPRYEHGRAPRGPRLRQQRRDARARSGRARPGHAGRLMRPFHKGGLRCSSTSSI